MSDSDSRDRVTKLRAELVKVQRTLHGYAQSRPEEPVNRGEFFAAHAGFVSRLIDVLDVIGEAE